jgi:O-antigen ligase
MAGTQYRLIKLGNVSETSVEPRPSRSVRYVAIPTKGIPLAVRWSYLLFVFTLPFDATGLGVMSGSLSVAKIAGLIFFAFYFVYYAFLSSEGSFAHPPGAMWWFFIYVVIFALNSFLGPIEFGRSDVAVAFSLVQLLVFFWFTSDLLKKENMARDVLLTYAIASCVLAVGTVFGFPGFSPEIVGGRAEVFGDNPNASGQHMILAVLVLIGLTLNRAFKRWCTNKVLVPVLMMLLLAGMVATGSRAAAGALVIGCAAYLVPRWGSRQVVISVILATLGIGGSIYMIANNPEFAERWQATYYDEDWAGRQDIYGAAIDMISERPILGWSPIGAFYELGRRVGWPTGRDTHNLFLDLLVGVGLVGAIPFLIGLYLCVRTAWRARSGSFGMLPLALVAANLTASMTHTNLTWKPQWFVLALAFAVAPSKGGAFRNLSVCFRRAESPHRPDLRNKQPR